MSKTLLLSMPYGNSYGKINVKSLGFWVPPVGLAYVGSYLKEKGFEVKLIDLMFSDGWEDIERIIRVESPDLVGLSATTPQISAAFKVAKMVKAISKDIRVVVGGIHASALPEETIADENIDILAYGEGELTMAEIVSGKQLQAIEGIYYKNNGQIVKNKPRELVKDIDIFPYPLYKDLPVSKYGTEHFGSILGIISTRGCPYQCVYCAANTIHKRQYRKRSIQNVIGEIERLKKDFKAARFSFYDDTFILDKKRIVDLCEALIRSNLNMKWNCIVRADSLDREILKVLKRAGCWSIQIGIESGDNEILRLAKRSETVEDALRAVKWTKELGMEVIGLFILGLPYETKSTICRTIKLAKTINVDYAQFSILVPLPGSEVWDMAKKGNGLNLTSEDWDNFGRYGEPIIALKDINKKELSHYFVKAYRDFYLRPGYIFNRLRSMRSLSEFKSLFMRGTTLLKFFVK